MKPKWKNVIFENLSYKVVSLIIALILWLTILGRRDFTLSKSIDVEVILSSQQVLVSQNPDAVKVRLSGPRTALKKFMDSGMSQLIAIDVSKRSEGEFEVDVPVNKIDVPFGVRVDSVKPPSIRIKLAKKVGG